MQSSWQNNVVEQTMLLTIVLTMLFSIDEAAMVVHGCWNRRKQKLIEQLSLFAIVIIVAQPC